jgi:predicted PurR-regulated permease PerM
MTDSSHSSNDKRFFSNALEAFIRIGIVGLLAIWCFQIGRPFIHIILWGIIIAVAIHPAYRKLKAIMGERGKLAATLITLFALILLIVPAVILTGSLIDGVQDLSIRLRNGTLDLPPPSESISSWPVIGNSLYQTWSLASANLTAALSKFAPQLKAFSGWVLSAGAGTGAGILQFFISIIVGGILLANAESAYKLAQAIGRRLAGERGAEFVDVAGATLRSVTKGILGVAIIQSILAGLGCLVVGVPAAGLWAMFVLLLAVIQLPPLLILGPIIIYVFSTANTLTAVLFAIWSVFVGMSDTFLKPILLGRGVQVPMIIVFIGAIGGFISSGLIGLFVGAIVFVLGYQLFLEWLDVEAEPTAAPSKLEV